MLKEVIDTEAFSSGQLLAAETPLGMRDFKGGALITRMNSAMLSLPAVCSPHPFSVFLGLAGRQQLGPLPLPGEGSWGRV